MKMKKFHTFLLLAAVAVSQLSAQVTVSWGSIDKRYPVEVKAEIKPIKSPSLTAWKGERVNMQLVVTNTAEEQEMFRGKMEAYCSHDGMTLDEYREQYLEEADQAPSQTMQM